MNTGYFRSAATRQDDAEHSTRWEPTGAREPMALPLRDFRPVGKGNSQARNSSIHAMQRTHGNRAVQRYVHGSISSHSRASLPVQREEGGMWDYAKKLTGIDQIGPGIENIVGKAKSGYNWAEKKALDLFKPGGESPAPDPEDVPRPDYSSMIQVLPWSWGVTNPGSFADLPEEQYGAW